MIDQITQTMESTSTARRAGRAALPSYIISTDPHEVARWRLLNARVKAKGGTDADVARAWFVPGI